MGTNSSTLRSVESLGDTLRSIESRLFDIEDIALHHETGIFSNNTCVVSGKVILGNPNIRLTIGPILGLVGTSFFRVLVETNSSGPLTFNVFKCIPGIPHRRRFVSTININAVEGSPSVIMVSNLDPGIEYWGFLGGIHPDEIHNNVVQVHTLSTDIENVQAFACKSINNVSTFEDSRVQMQLLSAVSCNNGPSWVFNLGNLLRLQPIFWRSITQLLSSNNCEENGMSDWELRLSEFERCVRQEYRNALSSSLVQQLGKRCCCIFLADENESFGSHLISISELYGSTESSSSILGRNDSPKVSLFGSSQRDKTLSELQALPKVTEHTSEVVDHILAAVARILR